MHYGRRCWRRCEYCSSVLILTSYLSVLDFIFLLDHKDNLHFLPPVSILLQPPITDMISQHPPKIPFLYSWSSLFSSFFISLTTLGMLPLASRKVYRLYPNNLWISLVPIHQMSLTVSLASAVHSLHQMNASILSLRMCVRTSDAPAPHQLSDSVLQLPWRWNELR